MDQSPAELSVSKRQTAMAAKKKNGEAEKEKVVKVAQPSRHELTSAKVQNMRKKLKAVCFHTSSRPMAQTVFSHWAFIDGSELV